jgi:hypothetical protein
MVSLLLAVVFVLHLVLGLSCLLLQYMQSGQEQGARQRFLAAILTIQCRAYDYNRTHEEYKHR